MEQAHGEFFPDDYQKKLMAEFCYGNEEPEYGHRLFFENSGGSLRLRRAVKAKADLEEYPDCPERTRGRGLKFGEVVSEGTKDIMETIFAQTHDVQSEVDFATRKRCAATNTRVQIKKI